MKVTFITVIVTVTTVLGYDDNLARNKFYPLAMAAFIPQPQSCLNSHFQNYEVTKYIKTDCGGTSPMLKVCAGFAGVSHQDQAVFVSYRGTISGTQLAVESASLNTMPLLPAGIGGKVANYFGKVYNSLRQNGLNAEVQRLAAQYPNYKVWVTGHSLGAALASIGAGELVKLDGIDRNRIMLMAFGQPRTGDVTYANIFEQTVPYAKRVVNQYDAVIHSPPKIKGHIHHGQEIWYPNGMAPGATFYQCNGREDLNCSSGKPGAAQASYHLNYFNKNAPAFVAAGCRY